MPKMPASSEIYLARLRTLLPHCEPKLTAFPSGAFMIDVPLAGEVHVVESVLNHGFGVSRMSTAVFGWEGVENAFSTFEEVEAYLISLLNVADPSERKA